MLLLPGVHRFKLPMVGVELECLNSYLLEGPRGHLLVDTGWDAPGVFDGLLREFAEDGVDPKKIANVVITHVHADHYGLAGRLRQFTGARILIHRLEEELIHDRYDDVDPLLGYVATWLAENGASGPELTKLQKVSMSMKQFVRVHHADAELADGDVVSTGAFDLRVLWTPGHAPGHVCLYEPRRRLLFSGDHILPHITPHIGLNPQNSGNPLGDFQASLAKVRDLPCDLVLPAHGEPFTGLRQRIEEMLRHHEERKEDIFRVLNCTHMTAYQVASGVVWSKDTGGKAFHELTYMDKRLAVMETLAHLELLVRAGKALMARENGLVTFTRAGCAGT